MIRNVNENDAAAICEIYNYYILNTIITFEVLPVDEGEIRSRIRKAEGHFPWVVHEQEGKVNGYAYSNEWRSRMAYEYTAESSVYIREGAVNRGIGTQLYLRLINDLKEKGIHAIIGGIALPNPASIALHERFGYRKVAHFNQVGRKFDLWIDVGYWELIVAKKSLK